jgi:MoCo/4Fe-4S cofactor protein with predicted Tat translocation signal
MTKKHTKPEHLDFEALRRSLIGTRGRRYWRCLEELAETEEFQEFLHREFPSQASVWGDSLGRRRFLKLMGASLALAGATACTRQPTEGIVPYVQEPEGVLPGRPLFFATSMTLGGSAIGLLVESNMGRPTKIEGNPRHPASLGATDVFSQASVLDLYDPDRARVVTRLGRIRSWEAFQQAITGDLEMLRMNQGSGLRILSETVISPSLGRQMEELLAAYPAARWHQYEPVNQDATLEGCRLAFGEPVNTYFRFEEAAVVVSLGADFLSRGPAGVRYARDFMNGRRARRADGQMNRLYVVEATPSITGSSADHRLPIRASEMLDFAAALAREVGAAGGPDAGTEGAARNAEWIRAASRDLLQHQGRCIVIAGEHESPEVQALALAMNQTLGNQGTTVIHTAPIQADPINQTDSLRELTRDMADGAVDVLVILGGNPVYTAPVDLNFADHLSRVRLRAHLSPHFNETSRLSHWHIPEAHYLEMWSDTRAYDGTASIVQPLIEPLFGGRSAHEVVATLQGTPRRGYEIVREYWQQESPGNDFERFWSTAVHDGVVPDSQFPPQQLAVRGPVVSGAVDTARRPGPEQRDETTAEGNLEILFRPDPTIYDGRFANNGWLQETPKPLTKLTWDNTVLVGTRTAEQLTLFNGDQVEVLYRGGSLTAPVWILPGQAEGCATIHLGYGRTATGVVGTNAGFNAYSLRTSENPWSDRGLSLRKTGERTRLASTQKHWSLQGRDHVRSSSFADYRENPEFAKDHHHVYTLYPDYLYPFSAWGMVIDQTSCTGCNACVVACQAENNVPIVGRNEVARAREMHWLRVDTYHTGSPDNPQTYHQPMLCQHCEKAPCEVVCPVAATVHSSEGLNDMIYNRCVGTRYCSNNCPYKVRRFNFLQYADQSLPILQLVRNPEVTVRDRGVMEKCTYCVQRINAARITAKKENRRIQDGEVVTACQAACPTQAIIFGDINDTDSSVAQLKNHPLNYGVLTELGTEPRTTYLAALRNPNPEIESE